MLKLYTIPKPLTQKEFQAEHTMSQLSQKCSVTIKLSNANPHRQKSERRRWHSHPSVAKSATWEELESDNKKNTHNTPEEYQNSYEYEEEEESYAPEQSRNEPVVERKTTDYDK